eukprot:scaffold36526_cov139-Skeletonema_dohrnii-CCMP3373.AAC.7
MVSDVRKFGFRNTIRAHISSSYGPAAAQPFLRCSSRILITLTVEMYSSSRRVLMFWFSGDLSNATATNS